MPGTLPPYLPTLSPRGLRQHIPTVPIARASYVRLCSEVRHTQVSPSGPKGMHPSKGPTPVGQEGDMLIYREKKEAASADPIHIVPLTHTPTLISDPLRFALTVACAISK